MERVIFTDLDGTLLNDDYSFRDALSALHLIKKKKIPLVISTSKTRAEIEVYRKRLKNKHPFISENGGAIFIPRGYFKNLFNIKKQINSNIKFCKIKSYNVIELGAPYKKIRDALKRIEDKIGFKIIGFGDMSIKEVSANSGLGIKEARLAKKREYDEAFILEKKYKKNIISLIKEEGLNYTIGGRYMHILGDNDKGKAVKILIDLYKKKYGKIQTISLGDSENDLSMLSATDRKHFVTGPLQWNKIVLNYIK